MNFELFYDMTEFLLNNSPEMELYYSEEEEEFYILLDEDVNEIYDPDFAEEIRGNQEKYVRIPNITDDLRYSFMCDFVEKLPSGRAKAMMRDALDDVCAYERFDEYMTGLGLEDSWNTFFTEQSIAYIKEWYENQA